MTAILDMTNNARGNMAYLASDDVPWHNMGTALDADASVERWREAAGFMHTVQTAPALYSVPADATADTKVIKTNGTRALVEFDGQNVLYRSDTGRPFATVSDRYQPVQPAEVLEFFADVAKDRGLRLRTAGMLKNGAVYWALASTDASVELPGGDRSDGFVLLSTSCDGSQATDARLTTVRVVCCNTLSMALRNSKGNAIRTRHTTRFDADKVRRALGLADFERSWDEYANAASAMAETGVSEFSAVCAYAQMLKDEAACAEARKIMERHVHALPASAVADVLEAGGRALRKAHDTMLRGRGQDTRAARGTAWGALNGITRYVDHERQARSADTRLTAAWFGAGDALKTAALKRFASMAGVTVDANAPDEAEDRYAISA